MFHYEAETGLLATLESKAGALWTLTYDPGDRVSYITDPFGRRTTFAYDGAARRRDPGFRQ